MTQSHTILGSKSQRGLTQMSLNVLFRSLGSRTIHPSSNPMLVPTLAATDASEAQILSASNFLEGVYGDGIAERVASRAPTPMTVGITPDIGPQSLTYPKSRGPRGQWSILGLGGVSSPHEENVPSVRPAAPLSTPSTGIGSPGKGPFPLPSQLPFWNSPRITRTVAKLRFGNLKDCGYTPSVPRKHLPQRPSALPQLPDVSDVTVNVRSDADYAILVSMYEVYNDRIFDLLSNTRNVKDHRRRALLFKPTEASADRKVVAGLRKIVCGNCEEALMVLEIGLMERRVAGTGSNSVSSRSHGFFCIEVRSRKSSGKSEWTSSQMTIVDLAGEYLWPMRKTCLIKTPSRFGASTKRQDSRCHSRRSWQNQRKPDVPRTMPPNAKRLARREQSKTTPLYPALTTPRHTNTTTPKPSLVPFRQCKLTELLFSNSFPSPHPTNHPTNPTPHRNPQKAIMIVTADPVGDFNATSQILRYSALAREVTVPRIPSVTSTIFSGSGTNATTITRSYGTNGRVTPNQGGGEDFEVAISEIARLNEEVEALNLRLLEEGNRRVEAEMRWRAAEEKAESVEALVREECWAEMERRLEEERGRWRGVWGVEVRSLLSLFFGAKKHAAYHFVSNRRIITTNI